MPSLPATITAIEISEPGKPEVLKPASRPMPLPGMGEVLIEVKAAGVNRPDIQQREGNYEPPPGASDIPGLEIAGKIVQVGLGVPHLKVGDEVCALVAGGGYASYCVAPAPQTLPVPKGLTMVEAAAIPETFFTVWTNVFERARFQPGESILIHGGTSGIGTTAIQLTRALGAGQVFATAGTVEKCRACEELGATRGINYKIMDFLKLVRELTAGRGVDVILDMVGGDYFQKNLSALAMEGRLVHVAFLKGAKVEVNLAPIMMKRLTVTGSTLRPRTVEQKGAIAAALHRVVWPLLEKKQVKPVIYRTFRLAEAAAAHRLMETSEHIGKIVLVA
ncbi:MAG TPA: NAD(P)H-quinone oxidoreductase [Stellaceae bacterium]|nr:NAD(P)H-quinone oxidoreductase [Stellaceae bacterium]